MLTNTFDEKGNAIFEVVIPDPIYFLDLAFNSRSESKRYYLTAQIFYSGIHFAIRKKIVDSMKWYLHDYLSPLPKLKPPISVTITICNKNKTKQDLDNKGYFWEKTMLDYLVKAEKIEDDNVNFIPEIIKRYEFAEDNLRLLIKENFST